VHGDKVSAAYYLAEHLDVRTKMMQTWADYFDELKDGTAFSARQRVDEASD